MSTPPIALDRGRVIDLSIQSGLTDMLRLDTEASRELSVRREIAFAHLVIEDFLSRSGLYLTNDVTREAAIAEAVAAEREAIIAACRAKANEWQQRPGRWQHHQGAAIGALACADLVAERGHAPEVPGCWCLTCRPMKPFLDPGSVRMALCPTCGNKRCPKANDHRHACTGSNEPGQPGSAYP